jgi:hypothetical protein
MGQVRIKLTPLTRIILDDLPPVCAECGEQAEFFIHQRFLSFPEKYFFLRPLAISPFGRVTLTVGKFQDVDVPLCKWHRKHWYRRQWGVVYGFVLIALPGIFAMAMDPTGPLGQSSPLVRLELQWLPFALLPFAFLGWLVWWVRYNLTAIRATQISAQEITLTNVSPTFVVVIEAEYNGDRPVTSQ